MALDEALNFWLHYLEVSFGRTAAAERSSLSGSFTSVTRQWLSLCRGRVTTLNLGLLNFGAVTVVDKILCRLLQILRRFSYINKVTTQ